MVRVGSSADRPWKRASRFPGDPDQFVNLIHIDDAAEAATRAMLGEVGWPVLVASDDRPTRRGDCYRLAARLLGTPEPRFDPEQRRTGRGDTNKRVLNGRLRAILGDDLRYPSIEQGLPAALEAERLSDIVTGPGIAENHR